MLPGMKPEDEALLGEVLETARTAAAAYIPRNPQWGPDYDPLTILANPLSHPEHELIALVNIRIAMHPEERWSKCADCGRIFLVREGDGTVCSPECFDSYLAYVNNP
jgi:hypothetical protein